MVMSKVTVFPLIVEAAEVSVLEITILALIGVGEYVHVGRIGGTAVAVGVEVDVGVEVAVGGRVLVADGELVEVGIVGEGKGVPSSSSGDSQNHPGSSTVLGSFISCPVSRSISSRISASRGKIFIHSQGL